MSIDERTKCSGTCVVELSLEPIELAGTEVEDVRLKRVKGVQEKQAKAAQVDSAIGTRLQILLNAPDFLSWLPVMMWTGIRSRSSAALTSAYLLFCSVVLVIAGEKGKINGSGRHSGWSAADVRSSDE